jgi:PDZ domain-containing protein
MRDAAARTGGSVRKILTSLIPVAVLALCLGSIPLPLFVERPGPARDVVPLIDIDGAATYQPQGHLYFTTVTFFEPTVYGALGGWLDPVQRVVPREAVIPQGVSRREFDRINVSLMDQSQIAAVAASLRDLKGYPREHGPGVIVYETVRGSPADGRLFPGDLITEVDGEPLEGVAQFARAVRDAGEGGALFLRVRPLEGGEAETIEVRAGRLDDRVAVGVYLVPGFPFEVRFESGDVSGPSAGLMWALGVTDMLTPGDLSEERSVAGTGTIDIEGNVGPIGGVALKVAAAEEAGAEVFLLPQRNLAEARTAGADIRLVPVSTLDQAVAYLEGDS